MAPMVEQQPLLGGVRIPNPHRFGLCLLLTSQFFERMAFYGLLANFLYFLNGNPLAWSTYNAAGIIFVFNSFSYIFSVLGAWLADAFLGKFKVMIIGYILYAIFYLPIPFIYWETWNGHAESTVPVFCLVKRPNGSENTWPGGRSSFPFSVDADDRHFWSERCVLIVFCSLLMIGAGSAFIKAVVTPFGADQVLHADTNEMRSFFNWYYWIINSGTFIAFFVLTYVQINVSMFWGYMSSYIMLILSGIIFAIGRPFLRVNPPGGSYVGELCGIMCYSSKCCSGHGPFENLDITMSGERSVSCCPTGCRQVRAVRPKCLDRSKTAHGGPYDSAKVEDVKTILHILLVFVCFIFYWACYFQTQSSFLSQGLHMKVEIFSSKGWTSMPVAWLSLIDVSMIVVLIPVLDKFFYPCLARFRCVPSLYLRMGIGMILSSAAMFVAGIVERQRMINFWGEDNPSAFIPRHRINQTIGNTTYFAANMSIFYQIPQYALVGLGEAFTSVAGLEFAYAMAPVRMQSLVTGLYWLFVGIGSLLGVALVQSMQGSFLFSNDYYDINYRKPCKVNGHYTQRVCAETRLDYYFYILCGVQGFGLVLFTVVAGLVLPWCGASQLPVYAGEDVGSEDEGERSRELRRSGINEACTRPVGGGALESRNTRS